jgi:hypothetical protein
VKILESDMKMSSREMDDIKEVLELVRDLNERGITGGSVVRSFCAA